MSWYDPGHDIVLDEAAFDRVAADFIELSGKVQALRADIEALLQTLQSGFDTPAGRLFVSSCKNNLLDPLDQQKLVIDRRLGKLSTRTDLLVIASSWMDGSTEGYAVRKGYPAVPTCIVQRITLHAPVRTDEPGDIEFSSRSIHASHWD